MLFRRVLLWYNHTGYVQHISSYLKQHFSCSSVLSNELEKWKSAMKELEKEKTKWTYTLIEKMMPDVNATALFIQKIQHITIVTDKSFKQWVDSVKLRALIADQRLSEEKLQELGNELSAAHFIVFRGGKVRLVGESKWRKRDEDAASDYDYDLPKAYNPDFKLEAIDGSELKIMYEGFENLNNLSHLKWLSLAETGICDYCIDRMCCNFHETLEYLDISNCTKISQYGLQAVARLRKLKFLKIHKMEHVENLELICLLLEEENKDLMIDKS